MRGRPARRSRFTTSTPVLGGAPIILSNTRAATQCVSDSFAYGREEPRGV